MNLCVLGWRQHPPLRMSTSWSLEPINVPVHDKSNFVQVIKLRILRWRDYLDYLCGPKCNPKTLYKWKMEARVTESKRLEDSMFLALMMKKGTMSKACWWPIETGKWKETDYPSSFQKKCGRANTEFILVRFLKL